MTRRVLAAVALGLTSAAVILGVLVVWGAAIWSLVEGPGSDWVLIALYVVVALAAPVPLLWCVQGFSALQARRLGIEVPLRGWRSAVTWRQLGYHLVAAFVSAAVARALLGPSRTDKLAQRVDSLTRSRADIVAATDAERRRIERDLHDGAQQRLVSLAMNLGMARESLKDVPEPARDAIAAAHDEATQALAELREFVRGLHPAVLDDRGLDAALSGIAARSPVPVRLRVDAPTRCAPAVEAVAYFVVSEALTNIAKHAAATRAEVAVVRTGDRLRIEVVDDGRGGADPGGSGLRGLAQRAAAVDGTLHVDSPPGGPTTLTVELSCGS